MRKNQSTAETEEEEFTFDPNVLKEIKMKVIAMANQTNMNRLIL